MGTGKNKTKQVNKKNWYQFALLLPFYGIYRLWCTTIRLEISEADRAKTELNDKASLIIFWHNSLFSVPMIQNRIWKNAQLNALISASGDGAWLEALFRLIKVTAVRGSSNFRGAQALKEIIRIVRKNESIGITPDGSKGPPYVLKQGTAAVAKTCKCAIKLYGIEYSSAWRLNSWDKFYIPKPFSKIKVRVDHIENYSELQAKDLDDASSILQKRIMKIHGPDPLIPDPAKS